MKPKMIAALVLLGLFLIVLFQNTQVVVLRLLFWEISMSQILLTFLTALIWFVAGYLVAKMTRGRRVSA
jgi:uncharacterized integral membrane protein